MKPSEYCTIITTTDNEENATLIAQTLLQEELAACVQTVPIKSAYRWKGKIVTSDEYRLDIKTKVSLFDDVKKRIETLHTYDVPEILMYTMKDAEFDYLRWIEEETRKPVIEESPDPNAWHCAD